MTAWSAVLLRDGQPVCDPVPCDDMDAAAVLAPLVVGWLGGPVSVMQAVVATRPVIVADEPSLFDELEAAS